MGRAAMAAADFVWVSTGRRGCLSVTHCRPDHHDNGAARATHLKAVQRQQRYDRQQAQLHEPLHNGDVAHQVDVSAQETQGTQGGWGTPGRR